MPEIAGSTVFTGGAATTRAEAADVAGVEPAPLVAVTTTRSVPPTSPGTGVYVDAVADGMSAQADPAALQRRHWWAYVIVGVPVQVPVEAAIVEPSVGVPLIAGSTVLTGSVGTTIAEAAAVA